MVLYLDSASIVLWYVHIWVMISNIRGNDGTVLRVLVLHPIVCIGFHCQVSLDNRFMFPLQFGSILHVQHDQLLAVLVTGWLVYQLLYSCADKCMVLYLDCASIVLWFVRIWVMISAACGYLHVQHNQL